MSFGPVTRVPLSAKLALKKSFDDESVVNMTQKSEKGSTYGVDDIQNYQQATESTMKDYSTLSAEAKTTATTPEFVGIKGAVSVPAASSYDDSGTSLNEIAANNGDLAQASKTENIELCGFLSDLPSIDIDMSAPQLGIPALQDIMKSVNGISMPALEFASDAIVGVVGGVSKAIGDLASAIQESIPKVTCGAEKQVAAPQAPSELGSAIKVAPPPTTGIVETVSPVGQQPNIVVSSPQTTLVSLNDQIDAGLF